MQKILYLQIPQKEPILSRKGQYPMLEIKIDGMRFKPVKKQRLTVSYRESRTKSGRGKPNIARKGNGFCRYRAIRRMASDLMKLSSGSTKTMEEMSSGRLPLLCSRDLPALLCKAANLRAPSLSNSNAVLTPPLHLRGREG